MHHLKTWPKFFEQAWQGNKPFEGGINDRKFQAGDEIVLMEYDHDNEIYSGREIRGMITYVLKDYHAITDGYVAFAYRADSFWVAPKRTEL